MRLALTAILFTLLLSSCSTPVETIIRDREVKVFVPPIHDTIPAYIHDTTYMQGELIEHHDTIAVVKYFPKEKKFYIYVNPDSAKYHDIDTTQAYRPNIDATPFLGAKWMKIFWAGGAFVLAICAVLKFKGIV